jgi:Tfp pilus assembly protein PilF
MKLPAVLIVLALLAGCATAPGPRSVVQLFDDRAFTAPTARIDAAAVLEISPEMKRFVGAEIDTGLGTTGRRRALVDALFRKSQLKLEYDSAVTRNAAETFAARTGNCLSLVLMTAAFAKELGVPFRYQHVYLDETLGRNGGMQLAIGHVNLALGSTRAVHSSSSAADADALTIDFLPPQDVRGLRTRVIAEETVVAMYMNNRAVESLAQGKVDDAYWWVREGIRQDPAYLAAYNTLGAVFQRHGDLEAAARVYGYALEREPRNTRVMSNLAPVLNDLGRVAESRELVRRLKELEPDPPFKYFYLGLAAMKTRNFQTARDYFAKEVAREPDYHEFQYWLASAYIGLGDIDEARHHLALAIENSTTRKDHDLYAAKLDRINAQRREAAHERASGN